MLFCGMTEWICNYLSATQLVDKCISYLFLYNILPQTLKVTHICFLSRLIWVKGLVSASESHKAAVKVLTGLRSHLKVQLGKDPLSYSHGFWFLTAVGLIEASFFKASSRKENALEGVR